MRLDDLIKERITGTVKLAGVDRTIRLVPDLDRAALEWQLPVPRWGVPPLGGVASAEAATAMDRAIFERTRQEREARLKAAIAAIGLGVTDEKGPWTRDWSAERVAKWADSIRAQLSSYQIMAVYLAVDALDSSTADVAGITTGTGSGKAGAPAS